MEINIIFKYHVHERCRLSLSFKDRNGNGYVVFEYAVKHSNNKKCPLTYKGKER